MKSETQAKAYVVKVTMDVVVWPKEFGHSENYAEARRVAVAAVESALRPSSDLRARNITAKQGVVRDVDMDLI